MTHLIGPVILIAIVCGGVALGLWLERREDHPIPPSHPAARAAAIRSALSPGRPLDAAERAVLARTESQLAADDAAWALVWAVVRSAGEPAR